MARLKVSDRRKPVAWVESSEINDGHWFETVEGCVGFILNESQVIIFDELGNPRILQNDINVKPLTEIELWIQ